MHLPDSEKHQQTGPVATELFVTCLVWLLVSVLEYFRLSQMCSSIVAVMLCAITLDVRNLWSVRLVLQLITIKKFRAISNLYKFWSVSLSRDVWPHTEFNPLLFKISFDWWQKKYFPKMVLSYRIYVELV